MAGRDSDAAAGIRLLTGRDVSSLFLGQDQVTNLEQLGESVWCTFGIFVGNMAGESAGNKIENRLVSWTVGKTVKNTVGKSVGDVVSTRPGDAG